MQILSYILTIISIILIIVMLLTFRKVRSVSVKAPLISIAVSLVGFIIYKAIIGTSLSSQLLWVLAITGIILGMWQGKKTDVWLEDGKRKAQNTMWFIVIWALGFGFNQLLAVTGQALSMNLGIGSLSFTTGITMGAQGMIFMKLVNARPRKTPVTPSNVPATAQVAIGKCPNCGINNAKFQNYCSNCGQKLSAAITTKSNPAYTNQKTSVKKASGAWWILAFLPFIGIMIVWATLRKTDKSLADRISLVNLALTMIILISIFQNRI
jgi:hypothetical protein